MTTTSSSFPSAIEAYEIQKTGVAKNHGFALFPIRGDETHPGFIYTVGMAQHGLPELLVFFTEGMAPGTNNMVIQVAQHLITGSKRFEIAPLLRSFIRAGITVSDPTIHYHPEFLRGDDLKYAYQAYVTRAMRLRQELGMPKGVLVLNHADVPSIQQQRAMAMLSAS
ncbi:DUF4262 domain-containing protein [Synechococcus sp. WH 8016]|uniref:DUF4262 domain-containing protein n=1 Tax=Synechococcus sp. WH 8016 TaxID=166318 RepID=UPI00022DA15E|nr:DUF4262 domain-containing protein [Synechococcus sp. WH 8016]EHA63742.1 hypothetical protein Syn8016DRAFT_0783 [Synechococcus sp. WH 8016]